MRKTAVIEKLEKELLKSDIPEFRVGDTISIHTRIIEGSKERLQVFTGTVIARKGSGLSETVSLHRVAYGQGMERVFLLHSPRIAQIDIVKRGRVRRAKLYYLRGKQGKKARVQGDLTRALKDSAALKVKSQAAKAEAQAAKAAAAETATEA